MIAGHHDTILVLLSIVVAILSSYTALDLAARTNFATTRGWALTWLAGAAFVMGGGIWSMHFVAMLAYSMPGVVTAYDPLLTTVSLALAILVTGLGFSVVSRAKSLGSVLASGVVMGIGIVGMHYTGMAAMRMPASLNYDLTWVAISIFIAIGASIAALWLAFRASKGLPRSVAAVAMGLAIAGMHYAGMRAAAFTPGHDMAGMAPDDGFSQTNLALVVAAVTLALLSLALSAALFDRRFADLAQKEAVALRRSDEQFRSLYRRTPLPLHAMDEQGRLEEVSDAWLDLLGYQRDEVIGQKLTSFMTSESATRRIETDWPTLLAHGGPLALQYNLLTKSGEVLTVISNSRIERDDGGRFVQAIGGLIDLTASKRAEAALVQAQKMEAVGQLTGGVAHDFNNLLAVIMGSLELARRRLPPDEKIERLLDNALEGARRGASLTQRMLAFARKQDLQLAVVDVGALLTGMQDLLQRSIGPQIDIVTEQSTDLPTAHVDPNQLELAILNLAVNSRDAMPEGGSITIKAAEQTLTKASGDLQPGRYLLVSVTDTGSGMEPDVLQKSREPFFTTKGVGKGTGLGLSMVHGFAAQSGGALWLESRAGHGTTATIVLPAAQGGVSVAPAVTVETADLTRPLKILAVDDDNLVLMSTVDMLLDAGHEVLSAPSGAAALAVADDAGATLDLLITDQAMPGMRGTELLAKMRQRFPSLPVIIATGYSDLPAAANGVIVLHKPFAQDQLTAAIRNAVH